MSKLPVVKKIIEINNDFQPIINFLQNGNYNGILLNDIDYVEYIINKYNGDILFANSKIFYLLDNFLKIISFQAQNSQVKLDDETYKQLYNLAEGIIKSYNQFIVKNNIND